MHSKKLVQLKKRKIIILTTSLVESFYNECLNFPQNEEMQKRQYKTEKLTFLQTLIFTLHTRYNIWFPDLVWGHLCIVLGTVTEKAGLILTKLRPVD